MDERGKRLMLLTAIVGALVCQAHGLVGRRESLKTGEAELTRVKRGDSYGEQALVRVKRDNDEDLELTRVKRGPEEPGLTRVKRMEDEEPGLTRVKRMEDEEPGLTRVKRMEDEEPGLTRVKRTEAERELRRVKRPDENTGMSRTKRIRRDAQQAESAQTSRYVQGKQLLLQGDNSQPAEKAASANSGVQLEGETAEASGPARSVPSTHTNKLASGPTERKEIPSPRLPPIRSPGHWDTMESAQGNLDAQVERPRAEVSKNRHLGARGEWKAREEERELEDHAALHRRTHPKTGQRHRATVADRLAAKRHWLETHRGQRRRGDGVATRRGKHRQATMHAKEGRLREALSRRVEEEVKRGVTSQHHSKAQRVAPAGRASKRGHGKVWQRLQESAHRRQNRPHEKRNHAVRAKPVKAAPSAKAAPVHTETKAAV